MIKEVQILDFELKKYGKYGGIRFYDFLGEVDFFLGIYFFKFMKQSQL